MEDVPLPIQYAIESDGEGVPYMLARIQWPDVSESISPTNPKWKTNNHLFNMVYGSDGEWISAEDADRIAQSWGTTLD